MKFDGKFVIKKKLKLTSSNRKILSTITLTKITRVTFVCMYMSHITHIDTQLDSIYSKLNILTYSNPPRAG